MKRFLSILLVLIMVLGVLPGGMTASAAEQADSRQTITLNFREDVLKASKEDFWAKLGVSKHEDIRYAGTTGYMLEMNADIAAAYNKFLAWQKETLNWSINETDSAIANVWRCQGVYFNAGTELDWGLSFRPFYHVPEENKMVLDVVVPEGGAGLYRLNMDIYREGIKAPHYAINSSAGGGYADVSVNGEVVYEDFFFGGSNNYTSDNLGMVELKEGTNTITLASTMGYAGGTSYYERCSYPLKKIDFVPLEGLEAECGLTTVFNLRESYAPYDMSFAGCSAVSSDEDVVKASFDADGNLVLVGLSEDDATVRIFKGSEELFAIPVTITPKTSLVYDFSKAADKTVSGFHFIKTYEDLTDDGVPSDNWCFGALNADDAYWSEGDRAAILDNGRLEFTVEAAQEGWYAPSVDVFDQAKGGKAVLYFGDAYLGTLDTLAESKSFRSVQLRPLYLDAGEYTFSLQTSGCQLWWTGLRMKKVEEPGLQLTASEESLYGKQYRELSLDISAQWDLGNADDLSGAQWDFDYDASALKLRMDGNTLYVAGRKVGEHTLEVTAAVSGVSASLEIPVTIIEPSPLVEAKVEMPTVAQNQIARNTTHGFTYSLKAADGDTMTPNEVTISYDLDAEGIVALNEEAHTITGLKNGTVNITVTVKNGDVEMVETFPITVDDRGGNLLNTPSANFEADEWTNDNWDWNQPWNASQLSDREKCMVKTDVIEEADGNHVMRFQFDPNVTYNSDSRGTQTLTSNGRMLKLEPGRMYEASFMVRTENVSFPQGTNMKLFYQSYDCAGNQMGNYLLNLYETVEIPHKTPEWTRMSVKLHAPVEASSPFYYMSCFVMYPSSSIYYNMTGFNGTVYIDDIEIREVGFDRVETRIDQLLTDNKTIGNLLIEPYATTGDVIQLSADRLDLVSVESTDHNVVTFEGKMTTRPNGYGVDVPSIPVRLVGLNAEAYINSSVTIHGLTQTYAMDLTQTNMSDEIRDAYYSINGLDAVTLTPGTTAEGIVTGVTTQLVTKTEEEVRAEGSVYFVSSNPKVVSVDQATGDITAVGEGTATVTCYSNLGGRTKSDAVSVVVTDDTDLASMEISYSRDYMGTGQSVTLVISGKKSSGVDADMSLYPVTWSVNDTEIATVTKTGRLTAVKEGEAAVTASASINGKVVSATFVMTIVDNNDLPGQDVVYDLHHGKCLVLESGSLEEDGIAVNTQLTNHPLGFDSAHGVTVVPCYPGTVVALDFVIPRSGWYIPYTKATHFSWGGLADVYIDDMYVGQKDFGYGNQSYARTHSLNTIWLDAGVHTFTLHNVRSGYFWWCGIGFEATTDPNEMELSIGTKTTLLTGEQTSVTPAFKLANESVYYLQPVSSDPGTYTNYYTLTSSDPNVVSVSGGTLTGKKAGTATITMEGEINHEPFSKSVTVSVIEGSILTAELTAPKTTVRPGSEPLQLELTTYDVNDKVMDQSGPLPVIYESMNPDIATVDYYGKVTIKDQTGSAEIKATIIDGFNQVVTSIWITVTEGKSEPTLYTWEEREIARENTMKYDWAWNQKESVVNKADFVVENLDLYYDRITHEGIMRNGRIGKQGDPNVTRCPNCDMELSALYNHYPWIIDPINDPWKIQCPQCFARFPSNDFESFYKCGLDENGRFTRERALANGGEKYLVNELYPEKGEGWGVDDGFGYVTGKLLPSGEAEVRYYIAYYHLAQYYPLGAVGAEYCLLYAMENLRDAYLYTGEEKYGIAGTILLDRFGDVYHDFDYFKYSASRDRGKIVDYIWEGLNYQQMFATCADAFWPCMDSPEVVEYLRNRHVLKGIENPEDITPEYIRDHIDNDILLEIKYAVENGKSHGNLGMTEAAMAYTAVALDRLPESAEIIDWIFRAGETINIDSGTGAQIWTGGNVMADMVARVNRDGFGDEGSLAYNRMWGQNYVKIAEALGGYDRVQGADLWKNSKFLDLFISMNKPTVLGNSIIATGETGYMQAAAYYPQKDYLLKVFINTEEDQVAHWQSAQIIYAANNHSVDGLHADIFTKDPEHGIRAEIQRIVNEVGEWNASQSDMLCGEGLAILRNGPSKFIASQNMEQFSDYWMFFGLNGAAHGAYEALTIGIDAYGLSFTGGTGYPVVVNSGSAEREHFMRSTLSHNTVTVNLNQQLDIDKNSFPMHFDDAGKVKVMDAEAAQAYNETDIYRRTMVTVELEDEEYYAVDFFRVLGGRDHIYSFHIHGQDINSTEGLDFIHQPMGTYAGPDVELGAWYPNPYTGETAANLSVFNHSTAASWFDNVDRDANPDETFTVDFAVKDFHNRLQSSKGLGLRLTMMTEEPMTEVAITDGHPSNNGYNPKYVKYLMVNHKGSNNLDSMFTSVIEPYQYEYKIASSELAELTLVDGTEALTDKAVAVKVTRKDGQVDYIVYATNNSCTYNVAGLFDFRGFVGVCSYNANGALIYSYGNDAVTVGDRIENALPAITGEVVSFTEGIQQTYTMTVKVDQAVTESDFDGRYIYVNNDRKENGAYRIYGAKVNGDTVELDLFTQTLARKYIDGKNMDLGFIHNVEPGQTFSIPLSTVFDASAFFNLTTDQVVRSGNKLTLNLGVADTGATYEIDGLTAGMKFNAANGQLIWTPAKAQAGRWPITVKAVRGSEVLGEMSFVIYAVTYSGSAYSEDVCVHAKAVTYHVDGVTETVCPACCKITKNSDDEIVEKFDMAGSNMTLGNELKLNILVENEKLADGAYTVKITHDGKTVEKALERYNSSYSYVSYSVSAKQMSDAITAEVYKDGVAVSNVYTTSVRTYAMNILNNGKLGVDVKTLVVDMLNYGAEAQKFFSYNTEDLANAKLNNAQKALATKTVECKNYQVKGKNFYGSNLSLEDRIVLNLFFKNCEDSMTATISFTDYNGTAVSVDADLVQYKNDIYKVVVDEIVLADAFSPVTVKIFKDGAEFGSATDSVESYVARNTDSAINEAIMKFAFSAKSYLG